MAPPGLSSLTPTGTLRALAPVILTVPCPFGDMLNEILVSSPFAANPIALPVAEFVKSRKLTALPVVLNTIVVLQDCAPYDSRH